MAMSRSATLRPRTVVVLAIVLAALAHRSAFAQRASNGNAATVATANQADGDEAADVAKQLSNPIANLVSIPFQFNWQNHIAPFDSTRFLLNFQPVVPFTFNDDSNRARDDRAGGTGHWHEARAGSRLNSGTRRNATLTQGAQARKSDAIAQAMAGQPYERLHRFETRCGPRGACRRELLTNSSCPADGWKVCEPPQAA
jgi:hypothetical protein